MTVSARTVTPTAPETSTSTVTLVAEAVDLVVPVVVLEAPALPVTTSTTALDTPVTT